MPDTKPKERDSEYYKGIGFRCGLEIHQRLATRHKLFCSCTADMVEDQVEYTLERRQRAVAGELGHVDRSTMFESGKQRSFIYNTFKQGTCLVDIDEEPPHAMNMEAMQSALAIAAAFHSEVPDEIQPMRKEVVDGSDPSAFQRTMLVGYNGSMMMGESKIGIPFISLEEESSGIVESDRAKAVYNVNRLGVPLIEIDTDSWIKTPAEAAAVAGHIGLLLRICAKVQRGIGSIRQDVNVSITGGARVEVKGVQDLDTMEELIDNEISRQQALIRIKQELIDRNAKVHSPVDITNMFSDTDVKVIRGSVAEGKVYGLRLEGFEGIVGTEVMPDRRLGTEISDYVKSAGVKGIIHSDEDMKKYGFSAKELSGVKKELGIEQGDAFIIIAGSTPESTVSAIAIAKQRAEYALIGVPPETRAADQKTATSRFMRFLPGGSRMYPETDAKPIEIDMAMYKELANAVPDLESERKRLYNEIGNRQIAEQMILSQKFETYKRLVETTHANPLVIATMLLDKMTELRREKFEVDSIGEDALEGVFEAYAQGEIAKPAIVELLKKIPASKEDVGALIKKNHMERISGNKLKEIVDSFKGEDRNATIRKVMEKYRLNVDGEELNKMLGG